MRLSVVGCPDWKEFRPVIKCATLFYADELFSKKMLENLCVRIQFIKKLDVFGYAFVDNIINTGKPRQFIIQLNPHIGARNILATLAHEMVHIKQFAYCETDEALSKWKGKKVDSENVDYYDHPWEIEAHGMEVGLFTKFVIKENLWEVFEDIKNPDDPIEKISLGWKEIK